MDNSHYALVHTGEHCKMILMRSATQVKKAASLFQCLKVGGWWVDKYIFNVATKSCNSGLKLSLFLFCMTRFFLIWYKIPVH